MSDNNVNETVIHDTELGTFKCLSRHSAATVISLTDQKIRPTLNDFEKRLVEFAAQYNDVVFCQKAPENEDNICRVYCLHIARHIMRCKQIWKVNDKKLEQLDESTIGADASGEFKDRGIHRATSLILLPTRNSCKQVVECMHSMMNTLSGVGKSGAIVTNQQRFYQEFGNRDEMTEGGEEGEDLEEEEDDDAILAKRSVDSEASDEDAAPPEEDNDAIPHRRELKRKKKSSKVVTKRPKRLKMQKDENRGKPEDFQSSFRGNTHDNFRLGLCLNRKGVNLYTPFDKSDIIIASPLGLKFILDGHDDALKNLNFLSSIEILVLDRVEFLLMQNWMNVLQIVEEVNKLPEKITNCPLMRVKSHILKNEASLHRQLLCFSAIEHPLIHNFLCRFATNQQADLCYFPFLSVPKDGVETTTDLLTLNKYQPHHLKGRQAALKVKFVSVLTVSGEDAVKSVVVHSSTAPAAKTIQNWDPLYMLALRRFSAFEVRVLPLLTRGSHPGVFVCVPNYFELVRLRQLFTKHSLDFVTVSEYTSPKEQDRRFTLFQQGRVRILLFSERLHFYTRRRCIRGIKNLIFYGPPTLPQFWKEFIDMTEIDKSVDEQFLYLLYHPTLEAMQLTSFLGVEFFRRLAWEPVDEK